VTTASSQQTSWECINNNAIVKSGDTFFADIPDGIEFLGDGTKQIGLTISSPTGSRPPRPFRRRSPSPPSSTERTSMARTALPVTAPNKAGVPLGFTASDQVNGNSFVNDGRSVVVVRNTGARRRRSRSG
jgi:hypothetical protein